MATAKTLTITLEDNDIVIDDGTGNLGGNLILSTGDTVKWVNSTGQTCTLRFRRLHLGSSPGYGDKAWPFDPPKPPGRDIVIAPGADSGFKTVKKTSVTANGKAVHVKYDVEVGSGASAVKEDPIVIIEK